jgi:hypothetical protein
MFQWSSWLQPQEQETQTVGVSIERFCIMCYPNKCDVSLWICSIGEFFSIFGVLLFLTVLGRAAFVLPLSALSNYCTKSPNTKISPNHQVQTTHLLLWILDEYLTESLYSCGLCVCISLHPNDKSQNLKLICEELMYNLDQRPWPTSNCTKHSSLFCFLIFIQNFRWWGAESGCIQRFTNIV